MTQTVLNLHPDRSVRRHRGRALEHAGYRVLEAQTATEAIGIAREEVPDVIVLPASLRDTGAAGACRALVTATGSRSLVVCTGPGAGHGWELETLRAGAAACLPGDGADSLVAQLQALLPRHELLRESQELLAAFFDSAGAMRGIVEVAADDDVRHVVDNAVTRSFAGLADMSGRLGSELGEPRHILRLWVSNCRRSRETNAPVSFEYLDDRSVPGRWISAVVCCLGRAPEGTERFSYVATDVTGRKRAEESLEKTKNLLAEGQRIAHVGTFEYVADTLTTVWSEEEYHIYGLDPAGPSPAYDVMLVRSIHPDDAALLDRTFRAAMETGSIYELEHRIVRPDGSVRWVHNRAHPHFDEGGKLVRYVGVTLDITERRQAEDTLRRATRRFQTIVDHAPIAIYVKDRDGRFVFGNRRLEQYTGRALEALLGRTDYDFASKEDADRWRQNDLKVLEGQQVSECEEIGTDRDGRPYVNLSVKFPLTAESGTLVEVCGISTDITDRKRAEEALRRSQAETQALLENTPAGLVLFEAKRPYKVLAHNRYYQELFAEPFRSRGMVGLDIFEYAPAVEAEGVVAVFDEVVRTRQPTSFLDFPYKSNPPKQSWFNWHMSPLLLDGEVVALVSMSLDVTARHLAEEALQESERRERQRAAELQTILDTAPIGLAIAADASGHHIQGNRANEEMFGLPPDAELSKAGPDAAGFRAFQDGRELAPAELPMQRAIHGEVVREQVFDVVREDGQELAVYAKATPLFDEAGRPRGAVGAFLDITALKRAEEALLKANAALAEADRRKDEFIAVLSHELRNPLAPIRYALPLLGEQRLGQAGRRATAVIDRQLAHLVRLVDDLLDVSRITTGKIELRRDVVTLGSVVSAAVEAASPAIAAARHSLDIAVPGDAIWLHVDPARISQAITNLLHNSAKYTPTGGRIRLQAFASAGQAVIRVEDNGIGISPGALPGLFEMFHQVGGGHKSQGGLGIGLALAKQLVQLHGGTVEAHSAGENQGAEFVIRLPLAVAGGPRAEARQTEPRAEPTCLRVLVVDDNVDLVEMLAMIVEASGHQVRKAFDGQSAIAAAIEYQPHVVLLDVGMPDMDGVEVAKKLRRRPETSNVRIVALTGWGQVEDRQRTAEAGFDEHLTKPADPRQIQRILDEVAQRLVSAPGAG
jgi:PAS domain S-box-containing protein